MVGLSFLLLGLSTRARVNSPLSRPLTQRTGPAQAADE